MKKLISFLLLFAILLTACACAKKNEAEAAAPSGVPTLEELLAQQEAEQKQFEQDPAQVYGHIDQSVPQAGVYQLWNAEGVKLIAQHPDAKFQLLCHIDMGGAELAPIPEFTGELNGMNFTIRNFTVKGGAHDSFGFIAVNKGKINNLTLENVTFLPEGDLKNIGAFAGVNEGTILRNFINTSTMTVSAAAAGANCGGIVGLNTGSLQNNTCFVDLTVNTSAAMNIGGVAGAITAGTVEFIDQEGKLVITGENKTVGLIAGTISNMYIHECAFIGEQNTLNDKLFQNYFGAEEEVTFERLLYRENGREPLTPAQQALRDRVVEEMELMATVEWSTSQDLFHDCTCLLTVCHGNYMPGKLHVPPPAPAASPDWVGLGLGL